MAHNQFDHEDYYNTPISVDDAASMFRRKPNRNDRPYVAETTKLNNRKVDDWKKKVLQNVCNESGKLQVGRVGKSWQLYEEGKVIEKYIEMKEKGMFPEYSEEVIEFWKDFFENLTVEEMHGYGSGVVFAGWQIIQSYIKTWFAEQKWERLFSKSSDPLWWEKNYHPHTDYLEGRVLPLWDPEKFKDINQKVAAILGNEVGVDAATGFR